MTIGRMHALLPALILHAGALFGAATDPREIGPHNQQLSTSDAENTAFIQAIRTNNITSVRAQRPFPNYLCEQYKGKLTPLHVAVSMEHFNKDYDPKDMIDLFATTFKDPKPLFEAKADIRNPAYQYLCTGLWGERTHRKLYLSPIELAAHYSSMKTLAAIAHHMPISDIVLQNPDIAQHIAIYEILLSNNDELWKIKHNSYKIKSIIEQFGAKGVELLHKHGITNCFTTIDDESETVCHFYDKTFCTESAQREIDHLRPVGFCTQLKNWLNG